MTGGQPYDSGWPERRQPEGHTAAMGRGSVRSKCVGGGVVQFILQAFSDHATKPVPAEG